MFPWAGLNCCTSYSHASRSNSYLRMQGKFIELKLKSQSKNFAVEEGIINSVNDVLYRVKNYKEEISQCINSYEVNIKRERKVINSIENKIYS